MDAINPCRFSPGDQVTIAETGRNAVVVMVQWRDDAWHVMVDRPHTGGSTIRQFFLESQLLP